MWLAADANVLLSAVTGGRSQRVFAHPAVEQVITAETTYAEVREYAIHLANKRRLSMDIVLTAVATLPVTIVERAGYSSALPEASRRIGNLDPDDMDLLALALHQDVPVWSNDSHIGGTGIEWYTTAQLLKKLDSGR